MSLWHCKANGTFGQFGDYVLASNAEEARAKIPPDSSGVADSGVAGTEGEMSKQKVWGSYPHNLSFAPDLWAWLQSKRNVNGMIVPLSAVITKYMRDEMKRNPLTVPKAWIVRGNKPVVENPVVEKPVKQKKTGFLSKKPVKPIAPFLKPISKAKVKSKANQQQGAVAQVLTAESWEIKVTDETPGWVRAIAKQLERA